MHDGNNQKIEINIRTKEERNSLREDMFLERNGMRGAPKMELALSNALDLLDEKDKKIAASNFKLAHLESVLRAISQWDMINPPNPDTLADGTWLRSLIDEASNVLSDNADEIAALKEDLADDVAYERRISELSDALLRKTLKEKWNLLWGPELEDLGAVFDRLHVRIAKLEADLKTKADEIAAHDGLCDAIGAQPYLLARIKQLESVLEKADVIRDLVLEAAPLTWAVGTQFEEHAYCWEKEITSANEAYDQVRAFERKTTEGHTGNPKAVTRKEPESVPSPYMEPSRPAEAPSEPGSLRGKNVCPTCSRTIGSIGHLYSECERDFERAEGQDGEIKAGQQEPESVPQRSLSPRNTHDFLARIVWDKSEQEWQLYAFRDSGDYAWLSPDEDHQEIICIFSTSAGHTSYKKFSDALKAVRDWIFSRDRCVDHAAAGKVSSADNRTSIAVEGHGDEWKYTGD